jgi:uncharacterized YccA/Bax inhibitor family protein
VRTTNPVLTRLGADAARERRENPQVFGQQAAQTAYPTDESVLGASAPPDTRPMTIDDVVVRTVGLISLVVLSAAASWVMLPPQTRIPFAAAMVGLVLGLVIAFKRVTNPYVISAYALIMGVFVGGISRTLEELANGVVMQAVIATLAVFLLMGFLYKSGTIRATPKFVKFMVGALLACGAAILINLAVTLFTGAPTMMRDGGPIAIIVSLVFITVAALSFILSFHEVEEGVRLGLPQKYAWACAFGILVSLIWLYIEMLRFLSYFQGE